MLMKPFPIILQPMSTYFLHHDYHFRATVLRYLVDKASTANNTPADVASIFLILKAMLIRFGNDEIVESVPLVFKLQVRAYSS